MRAKTVCEIEADEAIGIIHHAWQEHPRDNGSYADEKE
jgi:hypothetical protein